MDKYLGMYVHMHWAYGHPYAARTWTFDDWRGYARGLHALGYNFIMIWPITETMPDPPTPSDIKWMQKLGKVIDMLHDEFGFHVLFTLGPNVIGNYKAREYEWAKRPYFQTDSRLDPGDPEQMDKLINHRRNLLKYVANADGFSIIDSDPGGYIGSTNDEFADLMWRHLRMMQEFNPNIILYYWMWVGWESYNEFWRGVEAGEGVKLEWKLGDFEHVLRRMKQWPSDNWRLTSSNPIHQQAIENQGLADRAIFLPYGLIEGEPTFPYTNCNPERIQEGLQRYAEIHSFLGALGNSQTHAVQTPGAYLFSHFVKGGSMDDLDLAGFADRLVPGHSEIVTRAWHALTQRCASAARELIIPIARAAAGDPAGGDSAGLLLQPPRAFLEDLALQLAFRADSLDLAAAVARGEDWKPPMRTLVNSWGNWAQRTGFADACGGPAIATLEQPLREVHDSGITAALDQFGEWRKPELRHGVIHRLLNAMRAACEG